MFTADCANKLETLKVCDVSCYLSNGYEKKPSICTIYMYMYYVVFWK